jgi:hypothetical protein
MLRWLGTPRKSRALLPEPMKKEHIWCSSPQMCRRPSHPPVLGSLNLHPLAMVILHGYTWPVGSDSFGRCCVLAYLYHLRFLLRSVRFLGPFALVLVALVACVDPICARTCAYTLSISACVISLLFALISVNVSTNREWRSAIVRHI